MTTYIGVDPGLSGAVAVLSGSAETRIFDTPTAMSGGKRRYAVALMREVLAAFPNRDVQAALEKVHAMPHQGVVSMFTMGEGLGLWQGLLAGMGIPYTMIAPQTWKKVMLRDMDTDKNASRLRALQLFPAVAGQLALVKHHNRAEALLLAKYLSLQSSGGGLPDFP